jgi:uncharacterized membrane protein
VLSHWLLGIHRIKDDSPTPLLWDVAWLFLFGLLPLALAYRLRQGNKFGGGAAVASLLGALVVGTGVWAAQGPGESDTAIAVFWPGLSKSEAMRAIQSSGGRLLWEQRGIWAVRWPDEASTATLYREGAMLVGSGFFAAGCLAFMEQPAV